MSLRTRLCLIGSLVACVGGVLTADIARGVVLYEETFESYEVGTLLNTIPGWVHTFEDPNNVPVVVEETTPTTNRFLTTGTVNNQPVRYAYPFTNPGFFSGTTLTFTVDMWDPFINPQSSSSTFPRAYLGIYELAQPSGMPPYFGMETDDTDPFDDPTTAEWVVAGEGFEPRMFSSNPAIEQDTWYSVRSVWNFGAGTMNLQVKQRDSADPFTDVFTDVPIGFEDPEQNLAALDAIQIRMLRGTRLDNIRVEYDVVMPPGTPGDYNDDGTVDAADFVVWRNNEGQTVTLPNDTTGNPVVGQDQYNLWTANFGSSQASAAGHVAGVVPEPATWGLTLIAGMALVRLRRRSVAV